MTAPRGGHRGLPHTADVRIEAWAPTREECLAQAVRGIVDGFVDPAGAAAVRRHEVALRGDRDEDLLVALADEVVYRLDTADEVPLDVDLDAEAGGLRATLHMADAGSLPVVGAAPKAVTLHGLRLTHGPEGWRCALTLDV